MKISLDFETASMCDLSSRGSYNYANDPSTRVVLVGYSVDGGDVIVLDTRNNDFSTFLDICKTPGIIIHAFNAEFEKNIYDNILVKKHGFPEISVNQWRCDMALSAYFARPLNLKLACKAFKTKINKDDAGTRLINLFSKPNKFKTSDGDTIELLHPLIAPEMIKGITDEKVIKAWNKKLQDTDHFEAFKSYNRDDVYAQMGIQERALLSELSEFEKKVWGSTVRMNERGIRVDKELILGACEGIEKTIENFQKEIYRITNGSISSLSQVAKIVDYLNTKYEIGIQDLTEATVSSFLTNDNVPTDAKKILNLRKDYSSSSVKKYYKLKELLSEGDRIRGNIVYCGANRTGRFAGRAMQVHNLPRAKALSDIDLTNIKKINLDEYQSPLDLIKNSIRQVMIPSEGNSFVIADYKNIENRILAWISRSEDQLKSFRNKEDPYVAMAKKIFNTQNISKDQRQIAKVVVLGAGYGMSGSKFKLYAENFSVVLSDKEANNYISIFRKENDKIVKFWKGIEYACKHAIRYQGSVQSYNDIRVKVIAGDMFIKLPSGRSLCYPEVRLTKKTITNKLSGDTFEVEAISFSTQIQSKMGRDSTYGGKLTENICQAIARDILCDALLKLDNEKDGISEDGFNVVFHIHDEIACDTKRDISDLVEIMETSPEWAKDLPLAVDPFKVDRYQKL